MRYVTTPSNEQAADTVLWKDVDEGWIRYDQHSGTTQLFTPLTRFVTDLIDKSSRPLSPAEIVEEVLRTEPDAEPADCRVEVEAVLRILSDVQLIQPVHP